MPVRLATAWVGGDAGWRVLLLFFPGSHPKIVLTDDAVYLGNTGLLDMPDLRLMRKIRSSRVLDRVNRCFLSAARNTAKYLGKDGEPSCHFNLVRKPQEEQDAEIYIHPSKTI
jgi:hypothetical protein